MPHYHELKNIKNQDEKVKRDNKKTTIYAFIYQKQVDQHIKE